MKKVFGLIFLIGWVAGQLIRLPGEFPVTLLDVAVGGMAIGEMIKKIKRSRDGEENGERRFDKRINGQTDKLINGIILALAASWVLGLRLFSWKQSMPGGLYLLRFLGYLWFIANAGKLLAPVKKFIIPALWVFVILAWAQYLFLPDTRFLLELGWDEHYYRMIGTVLDPNYLGVMLGMIGIYAIKKEEGEKSRKRSNVWLAVLAFGGLAVTYSRASWLAVAIGLTLIGFGPGSTLACSRGLHPRVARARLRGSDAPTDFSNKKSGFVRRKLGRLGLLVIFMAVVWWVAPKPGGEGVNLLRTSSIEQRLVSWNQAIELWKQHPWFGVGFNQFGSNLPSSSWLTILQSTGVVGLMILGSLGILVIRKIRGNSFWEVVAIMLGVHAVFNNTLFYPPVLGLLALIKAASED